MKKIPLTKEKVVGFTIKIHEASSDTRPWWMFASAEVNDTIYNRAYLRAKRFALLLADPIYEVSKWEYDSERPTGHEYFNLATCYLGGQAPTADRGTVQPRRPGRLWLAQGPATRFPQLLQLPIRLTARYELRRHQRSPLPSV